MKAKPILFMDAMVAAILDGRKTVTRRIGKPWARVKPGDRLWVREAHSLLHACCWPDLPHREGRDDCGRVWAFYRTGFDRCAPRWRPSIHMPRWACRIELEVVSVHRGEAWRRGLLDQGAVVLSPPGSDLDILTQEEAAREGFVGPVYRIEFRRVPA